MNKNIPQLYRARLIFNGEVLKTTQFESLPDKAYKLAHDGLNPYKGEWVEIRLLEERK